LTVYQPPELPQDVLLSLDQGITKDLEILYLPFGGNALFFYDENLRIIQDVADLYHATRVIFTNQARGPNQPLAGTVLFRNTVTLFGHPSLSNFLRLVYPAGSYTFRNEYSFYAWGRNVAQLVSVQAYLQ